MVVSAAQYLDDQTILEKLPWISVDEVDDILARKDGERFGRFENEEQNTNPFQEQDEEEEEEEADEGGEA